MVREIINIAEASVTLNLPQEMVDKTIEVIAFEIYDSKKEISKAERRKQIDDLTKYRLIDLSSFKFDRDEANNYDE